PHLDPESNQIDNVCGGQEFIEIDGRKRHAISYLGEFMFAPDRVRMPVKALSGGEQNRAILAKLFSKPANLLVLDEPTNDLDIETLELLEEILLEFKGTVLLVSHDREFMDNVVTSILVLEGEGRVAEYVGGYSNWVEKGGKLDWFGDQDSDAPDRSSANRPKSGKNPAKPAVKKLGYKEQRELDALPGLIDQLESRCEALEIEISAPGFYERERNATQQTIDRLADTRSELEAAYDRWQELEGKMSEF
ncbi:MAG: ATP-binding cassette domain-containing protein, partial [Xanthomonadales bacterium]|nr:ATP-binding cassette domain-containing protein [Xanthomonadales bacterium]